ncbi:MAG: hypothetical protein R2823_10065 [Acidimicrobiia bacterium]
MPMTSTRHAAVATVVLADPDGGIEATLHALDAQVYEQVGVVVVGDSAVPDATVSGRRVVSRPTIAEVMSRLPAGVTHVWFVREGAVPRPDAMSSLIADMERTDASIGGSKVVGGVNHQLLSVGLVTDAFCVPYTGMDTEERDQGQYDVVRDVAAVAGISMMVRRDLLAGLGGVDEALEPFEAAVDLSQRARLKGARTIISPASVVDYAGTRRGGNRWRAEASRIRAMLKVYGPLTLAWAIPLDFLIGIVEAVVSVFLGRWLVFDFVRAWGWNLMKAPSTIAARRVARRGRTGGDPELFRFQRRGSVKMANLAQAVASALRRRLPGDDRLTVESIGADIRQPAFVVGGLAVVFVLLAARNIWSDGLPTVGYTMPFPVSGWDAVAGYAGGWNPAGLGSAEALRPLLLLVGLARILTLHIGNLAEYLLTAGSLLAGLWGMTRLLRTWSIPAAPALVGGIVYVAGPAAQGIANNTHIGTLIAVGLVPWALRLCLASLRDGVWAGVGRVAGVGLVFGVVGGLSPLFLLVLAPAIGVYAFLRMNDSGAWMGAILALAGTAIAGLMLSPWIWQVDLVAIARVGFSYWEVSPVFGVAGVVVAVAAVGGARSELRVVTGWAALIAAVGFLGSRAGDFGWGVETESVSLAIVGLGAAILIAAIFERVLASGIGSMRRVLLGIGAVASILLVVASLTIVLGGRVGLPGDVYADALGFTRANEGEAETSRVLLVGDAQDLPGDHRSIKGGAYRVVSATGPDLGETYLAPRGAFDDLLEEKLASIINGETRRAGGELAAFGIRWIVVMRGSSGVHTPGAAEAWRSVFAGQLDLLPLSSSPGNAVFVADVTPIGRALTSNSESWARTGWSYRGEAADGARVFVAENPDVRWGPDPSQIVGDMNEVSAAEGVVTFDADGGRRLQVLIVLGVAILLGSLGLVARRRR